MNSKRATHAGTGSVWLLALSCLVCSACSLAPNFAKPTIHPAAPRPAVLDVFPLEVGLTRRYLVTIEDARFGAAQPDVERWTGVVTETITDVYQDEEAWVFAARLQDAPTATESGFAATDRIERYRVQQDRVSGPGYVTWMILNWPLEVGKQWDVAGAEQEGQVIHVWEVEAQERVQTPAGTFAACYRLELNGNASEFILWFCPEVGIARAEFQHFGITYSEAWELQSIER